MSTWPIAHSRSIAIAFRPCPIERLSEPTCNMRLHSHAALTICCPSNALRLADFSRYTSLPAWQVQMVVSACEAPHISSKTTAWTFEAYALGYPVAGHIHEM